jgi:hypothetical protein
MAVNIPGRRCPVPRLADWIVKPSNKVASVVFTENNESGMGWQALHRSEETPAERKTK